MNKLIIIPIGGGGVSKPYINNINHLRNEVIINAK